MTSELSYKLGHYKITEVFGGGLLWESHHGLGTIQKGKCLIEGDLLILGPSEVEEPGFLKREFMDNLDKLANWDKTKYYCLSHSIRKCRTGCKLSFPKAMHDHVDQPLNSVEFRVRNAENSKKITNKQPDPKNEYVPLKDMLANLLDFVRKFVRGSA